MALERKDNIGDTTSSTGTGTINLSAVAQTGARIFAGNVTTSSTVRYDIRDAAGTEWEIGEGVFTDGSPDTLTRVTVYASSNSGSLVNFSAGTKNVSLVFVAQDVLDIMSTLNPIGTIREFNVSTNPSTLLGFGTWAAFGTGRVTVAIDSGQTEFDTNGETGGAKTHTLTIAEMPSHQHTSNASSLSATGSAAHDSAGGGLNQRANGLIAIPLQGGDGAHNNLQPYIVVYRWVRTA
jgi:microcystin-dependent protein